MAITVSVEPPLTPEQAAIAEALFRDLLALRRSGVTQATVHLDDGWGVRPNGKRRDVVPLQTRAKLIPT